MDQDVLLSGLTRSGIVSLSSSTSASSLPDNVTIGGLLPSNPDPSFHIYWPVESTDLQIITQFTAYHSLPPALVNRILMSALVNGDVVNIWKTGVLINKGFADVLILVLPSGATLGRELVSKDKITFLFC